MMTEPDVVPEILLPETIALGGPLERCGEVDEYLGREGLHFGLAHGIQIAPAILDFGRKRSRPRFEVAHQDGGSAVEQPGNHLAADNPRTAADKNTFSLHRSLNSRG